MAGVPIWAVLTVVLARDYLCLTRARKARPRAVLECHRAQPSLWLALRQELTADCGGTEEAGGRAL